MRSSSDIRDEINKINEDKQMLDNLKQSASSIEDSISSLSASFIKAGTAIEESGDIYGVPFDNGKTKENGMKFKQVAANLTDAIGEMNKVITTLEEDLIDLNSELTSALAREAAARAAQLAKKAAVSAAELAKNNSNNTKK